MVRSAKSGSLAERAAREREELQRDAGAGALVPGGGQRIVIAQTGNLGVLRNEELIVTVRLKDLLIVRGLKHYPQDLELTAERQHVALRSGCAAAFALDETGRDDVAIAIEVDPRALSGDREERTEQLHDIVAAVRRAVTEEHGIILGAVSLLSIGTMPKTSSGKLRRHACRQGFIEQTLDEMMRWTRHPDASEAARPDASAAGGRTCFRVLTLLEESAA
jgi:acyl-CoA synthetase (AMP-forming)/AMP-acid ligase II